MWNSAKQQTTTSKRFIFKILQDLILTDLCMIFLLVARLHGDDRVRKGKHG